MFESFSRSVDALFDHAIALESESLILNRIRPEDQKDIWEIFGDEEVTRYTDFSTRSSYDDAKKVVDYFIRCYEDREQYRFAIRLKARSEMIGTIGIFEIDEDNGLIELGFELKRKHWNRGYMRESIQSLVQAFFKTMRGHRIEAVVTPGNSASEKVLEKCGFVKEGTFRKRDLIKGEYLDGIIYGLLEADLHA